LIERHSDQRAELSGARFEKAGGMQKANPPAMSFPGPSLP
jgi:hypothetical protein